MQGTSVLNITLYQQRPLEYYIRPKYAKLPKYHIAAGAIQRKSNIFYFFKKGNY